LEQRHRRLSLLSTTPIHNNNNYLRNAETKQTRKKREKRKKKEDEMNLKDEAEPATVA
jgi:hypothetical protein